MASIRSIDADNIVHSNSSRRSWISTSFRNPSDVFHKNAVAVEDEEESLQRAALEKLPTYNKMRLPMLPKVDDAGNVIDSEINLMNLDVQARKIFFNQIMKTAGVDTELFLKRLRDRFDQLSLIRRH
ncbi:Pleiotropic drug resistance protein 2 [Platanthera guangdongensis]|uniref:Pleiotropic drug resistance protein 2 n=1 Tax=Platanthera guangdongensis TaxID=2320717 RepID=A0ABR2N5V2_9ASPA